MTPTPKERVAKADHTAMPSSVSNRAIVTIMLAIKKSESNL